MSRSSIKAAAEICAEAGVASDQIGLVLRRMPAHGLAAALDLAAR